ncbi:hypothetical protein PIB30_084666 [Stylosanthes scabra]|uniref:Uncharacterized protein n=1 Tax=Stylosanthes scabra TaxID=79078 RepID=A0ABU6SUU5_9FABA|nr:hypothetical protein [Stylosanthes scabra]
MRLTRKSFFIARDVLTESRIEYEEESLNPMKVQIITRKWEKLARPIQGVELTVDRAVLIHLIMIGEDIRVEEIIADQIYKFVNKKNIRSKLAFPGIIALLCREAKVKVPGDTFIPQEPGIDAEAMARVREPREPR